MTNEEKLEMENIALRSMCRAAAEEINRHWKAHCDSQGFGPVNLTTVLEGTLNPTLYPSGMDEKDIKRWIKLKSRQNKEERDRKLMNTIVEAVEAGKKYSDIRWRPASEHPCNFDAVMIFSCTVDGGEETDNYFIGTAADLGLGYIGKPEFNIKIVHWAYIDAQL